MEHARVALMHGGYELIVLVRRLDHLNGQFRERSFVQVPVCFESMHPPPTNPMLTQTCWSFPGAEGR